MLIQSRSARSRRDILHITWFSHCSMDWLAKRIYKQPPPALVLQENPSNELPSEEAAPSGAALPHMLSCHRHFIPGYIAYTSQTTFYNSINVFEMPSGILLHSSPRHGAFDTLRRHAAFNSALCVLLLLHGGIVLAHVGKMSRPIWAVADGHANADLTRC